MPRAELRVRDWPFGAATRRRLLEALLLDKQPEHGWTKTALEQRAKVEPGGLDEVLGGAVQLKLVKRDGDLWRRADPLPDIAGPLSELAEQSRKLSTAKVKPPPKRRYQRRAP